MCALLRTGLFALLIAAGASAFADLGSANCDQPSTEMRVYVWTDKGFQYDCNSCYAKVAGKMVQINKLQIVDRLADGSARTIQIIDPAKVGFFLIYDADTFLRAVDTKTGVLLAITSCSTMNL